MIAEGLDVFYLPVEKEIPSTEEVTETEDKPNPLPRPSPARFKVRKILGGSRSQTRHVMEPKLDHDEFTKK